MGPEAKSNISSMNMSRMNFLSSVATATFVSTGLLLQEEAVFAEETTTSDDIIKLASGVSYKVTTNGDGPRPETGELAAIRFKAKVLENGNTIDDIFNTP